jgi:hypothetical protein
MKPKGNGTAARLALIGTALAIVVLASALAHFYIS